MRSCQVQLVSSKALLGVILSFAPWAIASAELVHEVSGSLGTRATDVSVSEQVKSTAEAEQAATALGASVVPTSTPDALEGAGPLGARRWSKEQLQQLRDEIRTTSRDYPLAEPTK